MESLCHLNGRLEQIVTGRNQSAGNIIPAQLLLRHKKRETTCRFWIPQRFTEENSCFGEGFKFRCSPSCHHSEFKTQLVEKFRMRSIGKAREKKSKEERRIRQNITRARTNKQKTCIVYHCFWAESTSWVKKMPLINYLQFKIFMDAIPQEQMKSICQMAVNCWSWSPLSIAY